MRRPSRRLVFALTAWLLAAVLLWNLIDPGTPVRALDRPLVLVQVAGPSPTIGIEIPGSVTFAHSATAEPAASGTPPVVATQVADLGACVARAEGRSVHLAWSGASRSFDGGEVILEPDDEQPIRVGALSVPGRLILRTAAPGQIVALDELDIETYVAGVLFSEMPASFRTAALEAQAIAARSYAWHQTRVWQRPLFADQRSQVFRGHQSLEAARPYVESTAGQILTWDGKPLRAYYHSTCGGRTESAAIVFGEPAIPPYAGGACTSCQDSPRYRWKVRVPAHFVAHRFGGDAPVTSLSVGIERDAAEQVTAILITTPKGRSRHRFADWQQACREARLEPFFSNRILSVTTQDDAFIFEGAGWGHRVGLCQYGANGLARRGLGSQEILGWYYPGAALIRRWR